MYIMIVLGDHHDPPQPWTLVRIPYTKAFPSTKVGVSHKTNATNATTYFADYFFHSFLSFCSRSWGFIFYIGQFFPNQFLLFIQIKKKCESAYHFVLNHKTNATNATTYFADYFFHSFLSICSCSWGFIFYICRTVFSEAVLALYLNTEKM
jgi:hypothetical protein